jgi:LPS-assembly protein
VAENWSLIFDSTNLFKIDKFSGWDRVEGGGRANVGIRYNAQFNKAGYANALFGQSYQLFGLNSFAVRDPTNTGLDSGLDSNVSDYVASASYAPNSLYRLTSRFAFDHDNFSMKRFELEAAMNFQRWSFTTIYGSYGPQPDRGFPDRRQGILATASLYLATNWVLNGATRYDITAGQFTTFGVGLSYVDECAVFTLSYENDYYANTTQPDTRVLMQISLRTLGGYSFNQTVGGPNANR